MGVEPRPQRSPKPNKRSSYYYGTSEFDDTDISREKSSDSVPHGATTTRISETDDDLLPKEGIQVLFVKREE